MKLIADFHTHTKYSHGKGTIRENIEAAAKKGLKTIAIADHGPSHIGFGVKWKDIEEMRNEIEKIKKERDDIEILLGVEANIISLDGKIDVPPDMVDKFDIILAGYHIGAMPSSLKDGVNLFLINHLSKLIPSLRKKARLQNTKAVVAAINNNKIDILTHPGSKADIDTLEIAKAASKRGTALEINASHGSMTVEYVKIAMKEGVKFVINSDAHSPEVIGNFQKGIEIAKEAGLPEERIINSDKAK